VTPAILVLLELAVPLRAPDLQVEATTPNGTALPELADAVARALVASGARVLRGPSSSPCVYCAKVLVTESSAERVSIEVSQDRHHASASVSFPSGSPVLDRARAIAIQARLLVNWEVVPEPRSKDVAARPSPRKAEPKAVAETAGPPMPASPVAPLVPPVASPPALPVTREPERVASPAPMVEAKPAAVEISYTKTAERKDDPKSPNEAQPAVPSAKSGREAQLAAASRPSVPVLARAAAPVVASPPPRWPWIPTLVGSGAALAAGICAVVARNRYDALSDKSQPYETAKALKTQGESWQTASYVFAGAAALGIAVGAVGFATGSSRSATALVTPIPGGGVFAMAGALP
jgi:hypothetical protein